MAASRKAPQARREKSVIRKRLWNRIWFRGLALSAVGLLAYVLFSGPSGLANLHQLKSQNQTARDHLDSLKVYKQDLLVERDRLEHDSSYLEAMARRELGMAKPGEKVYRFMEGHSKSTQP